jgi:hypothetical protein
MVWENVQRKNWQFYRTEIYRALAARGSSRSELLQAGKL